MRITTLFIFLTLSLYSTGAGACDVCGCAAGSNYLGILPQFSKNLAGVRFHYRNFLHPQTEINMNGESRVMEDEFYTSEAWMRFYPGERWQLFVHVPYSVNKRYESMRTTAISGMGDIRLTANYELLNTGDSILTKWKNLLLVGGGVKLPTGKYQQRDETKLMLPAAFQTGSGAYSYIINMIHTLRYKTWGINTNFQYNFNGANEISYDYGDQYSIASSVFYWKEIGKAAYLPNMGVSYEQAAKDYQYAEVKPYSGGSSVFWNAGVDVYVGKLYINTYLQLPLSHDIPSAQPSTQLRCGAGVSFFF